MNKILLEKLAEVDKQLFLNVFNNTSSLWIRNMALRFSKSGDGELYFILCVGFYWFGAQQNNQLVMLSIVFGFLIERPLYFLAKRFIARARPCDCLTTNAYLIPRDRFSLPSGHSAGAFLIATILTYFFGELVIIWFVWASGVAISRVILGVHYPGDVVIGAAMGASCGAVAITTVMHL